MNFKSIDLKAYKNDPLQRKKVASKAGSWIFKAFRIFFLLSVGYIIIYPLLSMISYSLISRIDLYDPSIVWVPKHFTASNYTVAIEAMGYFKALWNTVYKCVFSALLEVASCSLVAYGLARFKFKENGLLFGIVLLTAIVPVQVYIIPSYLNYRFFELGGVIPFINENVLGPIGGWFGNPELAISTNLINSPLAFYLPAFFGVGIRSGLFIFIYRQFFLGLPKELEEASWIDGAGPFKTFLRVVIPSSGVVFLTVTIFAIIWYWNDYYQSIMFFNQDFPLAVSLNGITGVLQGMGYAYEKSLGPTMAGCLLFIAPMLLMYAILQKQFIASIDRVGIVG